MHLLLLLLSLFTATTILEAPSKEEPAALYISTDRGGSWKALTDGLPGDAMTRNVLEHDNKLYLTTLEYGVFVLPHGEYTWQRSSAGLPKDIYITAIGGHENHMILGTYEHGVYISHDGGANWRKPFFNVKNRSIRTMIYHENRWLAGTETGLLASYDHGVSWQNAGKGTEIINEMAVHKGQLFVAKQNGMGIMKNGQITWLDVETKESIIQLISQDDYLYVSSSRGNLMRSKDGHSWEGSIVKMTTINAIMSTNLAHALWHGYELELPGDMPFGKITPTSRGWVVGQTTGC